MKKLFLIVTGIFFIVLIIASCKLKYLNKRVEKGKENKFSVSTSSVILTNTPSVYTDKFFSIGQEMEEQGIGYEEVMKLIKMDAKPVFRKVEVDQLVLEVPYSEQWSIKGGKLQPIYTLSRNTPGVLVEFGKVFSNGTYLGHEYTLEATLVTSSASWPSLEELKQKVEGSCFSVKPKIITLKSKITGVLYASGGAKGCATVFVTYIDNYFIEFFRNPDIGKDDFRMTPEMRRIIESIRIKNLK